ncbi:MAG: hypothetical protein M0R06_15485 [Sphaerochaeta sp.]|nr:hypothetical protein [Sphaerochaeta sp.]
MARVMVAEGAEMMVVVAVLAGSAVPVAFVVWIQFHRRGHPGWGAIVAGAAHALFTVTAYWLWVGVA